MAIFLSGWLSCIVFLKSLANPGPITLPHPNGKHLSQRGIQRKREHCLIRQSTPNRAHAHTARPTGHDDGDSDHRAARPRRPSGCRPYQAPRRRAIPNRHGGEASGACFQEALGRSGGGEGRVGFQEACGYDGDGDGAASTKHAKAADVAKKLTASKKPKVAATKARAKVNAKTPASPKATRKTKKVAASSKPAPKKPVTKKPAAKQLPKKKGPTKERPKAPKLPPKRTDVLLPGPHEEVSSDSSDTDIPNPGYVSGADSPVPRTRSSTKGNAASANDATTSPPGRSPSPHPSLEVDYEESEPYMDHDVGEVKRSLKQITDAQRELHPGSPMSPKTVVAVERTRLLEASMSRRDDPPAAVSEPQVITNAGVDEGVPPELLQPDNRQHLADRTHQEASQVVGTKRDRETHAPRTQDQLLALRYRTRDEYREHLRQSRMPGPGAPQCDKCPVVLLVDTGFSRQRNETEFEGWLDHLGYPRPEFLNSPHRINWLDQRRLRVRMAKMIANNTWPNRFFDRHKPMPGVILEEVLQKIQKSWQSQPIEPKSVLGPVSADQVRGHAQKRPRGRRSPPRGEPQAPTSYDYSGSPATLPDTGTDRYTRGASVASQHGS
ncbi:hypothetical protein PR002_g19867 [Phytophthora rubi]|uniref:Uncharacterized protein n=1 Tax=Phytophthora rubi TaxID=129364 RepID=A0A6A3JJ61_9STRA|nr:hypothetical protein PR002_g19867 [Phytophthora rubi]